MRNIFDKIVHKLWMIDHHVNLADIDMRDVNEKVHLCWLRENSEELDVNSDHTTLNNLRDFAIKIIFENGFIYKYDLSSKKCLLPVKHNENMGLSAVPKIKNGSKINCEMRDFAADTLPKNGHDAILPGTETICEVNDFAAETLKKRRSRKFHHEHPK